MQISLFGGTSSFSYDKESKLHTSFFVRKPSLRRNYFENYIAVDIDMKIQFKFENLQNPVDSQFVVTKSQVDDMVNDPNILRNMLILRKKISLRFVLSK